MPSIGGHNYQARLARRKALLTKWTAKYRAQGLAAKDIERAIGKRLARTRI